jgi:hypothetical protein
LRIVGTEHARDFVVGQMRRQSIAAQKEPIALMDGPVDDFKFGPIARS